MAETLPRKKPSELGISPAAILRLLQALNSDNAGLHSFMLLRHGAVAAEGWWRPYRPESTHMLNSLSKSFTSTAIGFAVQEGLLSVEDTVLSFFPEKAKNPCKNMKKMKIKHLLTMSTGHRPNADSIFQFDDPVSAFLASDVAGEPGSFFSYNTAATYMLSAIITKVSGQTAFDYLTPRLFEPLGIHDIWWETCPLGNSMGGFGLHLKTEDIARFGQFLLERGCYQGKHLLDAVWIDTATTRHIRNDGSTQTPWLDAPEDQASALSNPDGDWSAGYGYQFWRCAPQGIYRGDGAFGQYCVVLPEQDAVIAITAGASDMQHILNQVWRILLPSFHSTPLSPEPVTQQRLESYLAALSVPMCENTTYENNGAGTVCFAGTYQIGNNPYGIRNVNFSFSSPHLSKEHDVITFLAGRRRYTITVGHETWSDSHLAFQPASSFPFRWMAFPDLSCRGAWLSPSHYALKVCFTGYVYVITIHFAFSDGRFTAELSQNVGTDGTSVIVQGFLIS